MKWQRKMKPQSVNLGGKNSDLAGRQRLGSAAFTLLALAALLAVSGCIPIPIQKHDDKVLGGNEVPATKVIGLQAGASTQQDVLAQLGQPEALWEDQRTFVYCWEMRKARVIFVPFGMDMNYDEERCYVLLAQFDEQDRLQRVDKTVRNGGESLGDHLLAWREAQPSAPPSISAAAESRPQTATVLLQVQAEYEGRDVRESLGIWRYRRGMPFGHHGLNLRVGTFKTGGQPLLTSPTKLPGKAGDAGWYRIKVPRGVNYLTISPTVSDRALLLGPEYPLRAHGWDRYRGPCYRLDVPNDAPIVYAGTLRVPCVVEKARFVDELWKTPAITSVLTDAVQVVDASSEAESLAGMLDPKAAKPATSLLRAHQGPFVIRTPEFP